MIRETLYGLPDEAVNCSNLSYVKPVYSGKVVEEWVTVTGVYRHGHEASTSVILRLGIASIENRIRMYI